jgi:hypothetical protein
VSVLAGLVAIAVVLPASNADLFAALEAVNDAVGSEGIVAQLKNV